MSKVKRQNGNEARWEFSNCKESSKGTRKDSSNTLKPQGESSANAYQNEMHCMLSAGGS